ncbi:MAG: ATP-binding protein [Bacteroidetes bacterium]|nr:ATP-binding protein [Bacteroidota bacterium]
MIEQLYTKHIKALNGLKEEYKSHLHDDILWKERLIGIKGARGVGKTTLILQHIKDNFGNDRKCLYVNLDDIAFPFDNLLHLVEEFEKTGGKYLFLDEIHKYANWSRELKNIYDNFPDISVVFTGSSILDILRGKADLSRRAVIYRMQGLSFREFLNIKTGKSFASYSLEELLKNHEDYSQKIALKAKPFQYFKDYLKYGYYPYFLESTENYHLKLSNTISLMLEVDLPLLFNVDIQNISKLKRFLNILSQDIPYKPNITNLAGAIGVSWKSVINYLHYLNDAEIIKILYHEGKEIGSLSKPELVNLHHPNHFFIFNEDVANSGSLRESFFINQLSYKNRVEKAKRGDFVVNGKYYFEVGGKNKTYHQIAKLKNSYIVADDIEYGFGNKIPLWLFGFLY